jgi:TatD DNase family protein
MTVHSLRAVRRVLELMRENDANCVNRYALHWFTGSTDELRAAIDFGCFFSVNQAMTKSRRGLQLLALAPSARVFTETDGPFILDGRRPLVPSGVAKVTADIANAWNVDFDSARQTIAQNFQRFLG